jgi:hypothetical protein
MKLRSIGRFAAGLLLAFPALVNAQLVTGLQGASGSAIGPDGALYVTEGAIGRLTRVDPVTGATTTVADGLPPSLIGIGGAIDVAFSTTRPTCSSRSSATPCSVRLIATAFTESTAPRASR